MASFFAHKKGGRLLQGSPFSLLVYPAISGTKNTPLGSAMLPAYSYAATGHSRLGAGRVSYRERILIYGGMDSGILCDS